MLEKTSLAETEFNSLYTDDLQKMLEEIKTLRAKIQELRGQIDWLERDNAKYL